MPPHSYKNHANTFSPFQVFYNYIHNFKTSIIQFFKQYLKPEGKQSLFLFNRYMIIILLLNIDIKLLICISLIVYIIVKIIKIKPWQKQKKLNLPLSYVNKLYEMQKQQILKKIKNQENNHDGFELKQQNSTISNQKNHLCKNIFQARQQLQKNLNNDIIITNFNVMQIQHQIYEVINKLTAIYCRIVWYIRWKSILILWIIVFVIYMFEPSRQYDTFKIKATKNGIFQIGQIQKASQIINHFHLIIIWLISNLIIFYYHGTQSLRRQLLLQIYTNQYAYNLIKKKKLKVSRSYTKQDKQDFLFSSTQPISSLLSPQFRSTLNNKKKKQNVVDLQQLKNFTFNTDQKNSNKNQIHDEMFSQRKFSHDLPILSNEATSSQINNNQTFSQMFPNTFVESQEQFQQEKENKKEQKKQQFLQKKMTIQLNLQENQNSQQQLDYFNSLTALQQTKKKPVLQRKGNFLQSNSNENLLTRTRKKSQQFKNQIYNDFKINLFKVQLSKHSAYQNN